jgi:signal transduction histidine kinase
VRWKSIRWRLPIAFLGITALTVILLGAVLFILLKTYYSELEQSYLRGASLAVPGDILEILKSEDSQAELQAYFENVAFLSQTRIQVTDVDGEIIADTGSRTSYNVGLGVRIDPDKYLEPDGSRIIEPYIVFREISNGQDRFPLDLSQMQTPESRLADSPERASPEAESSGTEGEVISAVVTQIPPSEDEVATVLNELPIYSTDFGIGFNGEETSSEVRSSENLQIEIHDTTGLLATIDFSEGPAYGQKILSSVAIGFLIAGALAMILGAYAGWLVSQRFSSPLLSLAESTASMAEGEYSTRVHIDREDEFGILAAAFNRMAEQVEKTIETLHRFISDAAHELNTPLTALHTNLELISDDQDGMIQRSYVDHALQQTRRLEQLTGALLDLSKLEAGAVDEEAALLNISQLILSESERYASIAEQKGIEFSLKLPREEIQMMGRPNQIRTIVSNLLDNAIKFTPEGGRVVIGLITESESIRLWVEDTGIGIPAGEIPLLFQRFHRAPNASAYPGNGLGLAMVSTIVEAHGGSMSVENQNPGVKLNIEFPTDALSEGSHIHKTRSTNMDMSS